MLAPVCGRVVCTLEPGVDGNVDARGTTSPRPANAPAWGVANERDGGTVRAYETARESGATRCAGTDAVGTCASVTLGPRVMTYDDCTGEATPGLAATYGRVRGAMRFTLAGGAMYVRTWGEKTYVAEQKT
jgi:hypothetical protein